MDKRIPYVPSNEELEERQEITFHVLTGLLRTPSILDELEERILHDDVFDFVRMKYAHSVSPVLLSGRAETPLISEQRG